MPGDLHRKAAPLSEYFFQDTLQLPHTVPVHHGIFDGHIHLVLALKGNVGLAEHVVLHDAVVFQLQQKAVLVKLQKLLGGILIRQTVFFLDLDRQLLIREELVLDPPLQIIDIVLVDQPGAF